MSEVVAVTGFAQLLASLRLLEGSSGPLLQPETLFPQASSRVLYMQGVPASLVTVKLCM